MGKVCFTCKILKDRSEFRASKENKDGLFSWCRSCCSIHDKIYNDKKRDDPVAKEKRRIMNQKRAADPVLKVRDAETRRLTRQSPEGKAKRTEYGLKSKFGLTLEAREKLIIDQGRRCQICEVDENHPRAANYDTFVVDHDHTTGRIRGMLCGLCNSMLGFAWEDEKIFEAAILYLRKHKNV